MRRNSFSASSEVRIAPSLLAADFWQLGRQIMAVEACQVDRLHIDVMDGHFVPNLALGPAIVEAVRPHTRLMMQVHLMVTAPERFLDSLVKAGADALVVHLEGAANLHRTVQCVRELGKQIGVALNPATPPNLLEDILPDLDEVLVMTVNPGFGGQEFIASSLNKIERLHGMIQRLNPRCQISVDGGISCDTAPQAVAAGARVLVVGSTIFRSSEPIPAAVARLRDAVSTAIDPSVPPRPR